MGETGFRKIFGFLQKGRKGAGVKGAGVANCRIFRSAVPAVVVWSILLVSLSGVKQKLWQFMTRAPLPPAPFADSSVFCGFLQKSAVSCGFLRKSATPKSLALQSEPKISENLQKSAKVCVPGPVSPFCCLPFGAPWQMLLSPRKNGLDSLFKEVRVFKVAVNQEDVNGEKQTVKKWWIFGADFFAVWCRFFTVYADFSRLIRDINAEKKKHLVIDDLFHG